MGSLIDLEEERALDMNKRSKVSLNLGRIMLLLPLYHVLVRVAFCSTGRVIGICCAPFASDD
jgi:hypothetical protein